MTHPAQLLGLATAAPPNVIAQDEAAAAAAHVFGGKVFRTPDLLQLFENTGIKTRRTVKPLGWYAQARDWRERNDAYLEGASALYLEAARKALAASGVAAEEVGAVVTVSTTGIATPSLEARLHGELGLAPGVVRVPVFGLGCAGGVSGLSIAARLARADPGRPVLLVVVELCSLACRADEASKANVVATALFGDGAAAAVLRAGPPEPGARPIEADSQHLWPDTLDIMGWTVDPTGFGIVLASTL
ncbi:MAG: type III polyketide synthase, partial [Caulobacteraceae bacterium]|nr:type III polyketide synthase [Caulobacter sp.]